MPATQRTGWTKKNAEKNSVKKEIRPVTGCFIIDTHRVFFAPVTRSTCYTMLRNASLSYAVHFICLPFLFLPKMSLLHHSLPACHRPAALVHPDRRRVLGAALALPWWGVCTGARAASSTPVRIGQSIALTGPLSDLGLAMHQGAQVAFAALNARGGVNGRPIELTTLDDGYEVARAVDNVDQLLAQPDCLALFNCMGTAMVAAVLPKVLQTGMPLFAPFTGAQLARIKGARNVFNIRASYADEAQSTPWASSALPWPTRPTPLAARCWPACSRPWRSSSSQTPPLPRCRTMPLTH